MRGDVQTGRARLARLAVAAVVVALLPGCGAGPARTQPLSRATSAFRTAAADGDASGLCALLTQDVVQSLEQGGQSCAAAVGQLDVNDPGTVTSTQIWGRDALVTFSQKGSDVFWTDVNGTWRITAAGCTLAEAAPADCDLEAS